MRKRANIRRMQALAAICCLACCSCRLTQPASRTPIVPAADLGAPKFMYAGDERYAPTALSSSTQLDEPRSFPTSTRSAGYATSSDVTTTNSASSDATSGNTNLKKPGGTASPYIRDAAIAPAGNFSVDDAATHSIDQREAGPANRWSIYGVDPRYAPVAPPAAFASLPAEAYTGYPGDGYTKPAYVPRYMRDPAASSGEVVVNDSGLTDPSVLENNSRVENGLCGSAEPLPANSCGPWKPPGISGPWPEDEYLFDGGDSDGSVKVRPDGQLEGLDSEDTVAYYQTLDGRTVVKPSCRVCLYSPRFAAVRQVTLAYGDNQLVRAGGVDMPIGPVPEKEIQPVTTALQPVQPVGEIGERAPITFLEHTPPIGLIAQTVVRATIDRLKPYEDFDLVRAGLLIEGEKPFIAKSMDAAIAWTTEQGVQVMIEGKKAVAIEGDRKAQATFSIEPPTHPCLRVCKMASTHSAQPGETVEFTLRFDNVGDQPVGNVTIVDNLTTRLQLVPGSGQCSRQADFFSEPNKEGSLVLRWEITEPLKPGEGGIARFKCIVR
jgi:uncharacterized repeat protein (TIGR01451 family)